MAHIIFQSARGTMLRKITVEAGTLLFDAAKQSGLPVASSCTAGNVCGKCNFQIVAGEQNLSEQLKPELDLLTRDHKPLTDRISCMTQVLGDCTVSAAYW